MRNITAPRTDSQEAFQIVKAPQQPFRDGMHRKPDNQYDHALHGALTPVTPSVDVKNVMRQIEQFVCPRQDDEGEKTDILTPQYQLRPFEVCHAMRVANQKISRLSLSQLITPLEQGTCTVSRYARKRRA